MTTSLLRRARLVAAVVLPLGAVAAVLGCSGPRVERPSNDVLNRTWLNVTQPTPDIYPSPQQATVAGLDAAFGHNPNPTPPPPQNANRPLNVLVLSAGGKYVAFIAGLMNGWTASGCRPQFDVVTGTSGGAVAGPYILLGPDYDAQLAEQFLTINRRDLFRIRPVRSALRTGSLASTEPFAQLIAREMDEKMLADLREAHARGQRLFVATGNRTTYRPAVWDVGAIASSGRPDANDLTRKVLLAAGSHPGFAPPVEFDVTVNGVRYCELHQDGGNIFQAFVQTPNGLPPGSNVYVLSAGKLFRDPVDTRGGPVRTLAAAASNTLYSLFRADVMQIYALCAVSRANFHLIDVPEDVVVKPGSLSFEPQDLQALYDAGYRYGANGIPWMRTPPSSQPGQTLMPRTGLDFVVPDATATETVVAPARSTPRPKLPESLTVPAMLPTRPRRSSPHAGRR